MTKILVIDTENTGALRNKAHPFDYRNRMCYFGAYDGNKLELINIQYGGIDMLCGSSVDKAKALVQGADLLVGFNIKYDLHWLRRYGITLRNNTVIWDCQLAQFLISNQAMRYPSLEATGALAGVEEAKSSVLKYYLSEGKDVDEIPLRELEEYLTTDLKTTYAVYKAQRKEMGRKWPLFNLQCQDLKVLADMEWNGMLYDMGKNKELCDFCTEEESKSSAMLKFFVPEIPVNWNSSFDVSAVLYGGKVRWTERQQIGVYATGQKKDQPRYRLVEREHSMPQLVAPLPRTALARLGSFSVAEKVLRQLKATGKGRTIINLLLEYSDYEKLRTTYLEGIPKTMRELNWENNVIHGSINQCVARTGRTSSNKPNLQNIPPAAKECFVSRYDNDS